ncbi:hypothetical protein J2809_002161 [Arthrobacter pascens]|uniref:hypothetical protein n=1 Tax=Arthrobacter pascens TaxID=1677 RepID=UPI00285E12E0|nr:hypothetical protein [Arthrobacter pascens]MDR6557801.1 hypothetical protein [Arthrobacter pascens]
MTTGEKLLNLTLEYQRALDAAERSESNGVAQDARTPQVIAAEYEQTLKDLLGAASNSPDRIDGGTP